MVAAGLLAKKAVEQGLTHQALGQDLAGAGLEGGHRVPGRGGADAVPGDARLPPRRLRLHHLHRQLRAAAAGDLRGDRGARPGRRRVLSGNRNFEGRINPEVRANYLASPPLVVAYALAGRIDIDLDKEPLGEGDGRTSRSSCATSGRRTARSPTPSARRSSRRCSRSAYGVVFEGDERWRKLRRAGRATPTLWDGASTYIKHPPYFEGMPQEAPAPSSDITGARVLAVLGDSVTTDHISPAGSIKKDGPAGQVPGRARRRAQGLQLLRRAPRQPRGDGARHLRQRPAAEPAGARHRGRRHPPPARRRGDVDLRRRREVRGGEGARSSSWRARSTAPARRATGRPRGRACWACGR